MTVPGHPRTSETLVRTKLPALKPLSPSEVRMTDSGHPRTSETLVRTNLPALKLSALPRYG
jgi:hypothetical protein